MQNGMQFPYNFSLTTILVAQVDRKRSVLCAYTITCDLDIWLLVHVDIIYVRFESQVQGHSLKNVLFRLWMRFTKWRIQYESPEGSTKRTQSHNLSVVCRVVGATSSERVLVLCVFETRVFATNSLTVLPEVDLIVVMKDGRIQETGTYDTLRANGGEFAKLLEEHTEENARERAAAALPGKQ